MTTDVAALATILMGWNEQQASDEIHGRAFIGPEETEEMLFETPPTLVARLAAISSDECSHYGARWAECADCDLEPSDLDTDRISRLTVLTAFARRAIAEKRGMYLWMSV